MKAYVKVKLKEGILDPQGEAIKNALKSMGFTGINDVKQAKLIELDLDETDSSKAKENVRLMCEKLLANTVIEGYCVEIAG